MGCFIRLYWYFFFICYPGWGWKRDIHPYLSLKAQKLRNPFPSQKTPFWPNLDRNSTQRVTQMATLCAAAAVAAQLVRFFSFEELRTWKMSRLIFLKTQFLPTSPQTAVPSAAKHTGAACALPCLLALMLNSYNTVWTDLTIRLWHIFCSVWLAVVQSYTSQVL